jgi:Hint domain
MPNFTWSAGASAAWTTPGDWDAGSVPNATDAAAVIAGLGAYTVSIAASETIAVDSLILDASSARLSVAGVLALGGADALLTLQAGALQGAGTVQGGTIALAGGYLQMSGGTLDGVTVLGTLAPSRFYAVNVQNGLRVVAADGSQPGSIDLSGGALNLLDSETLDNVAISVGGLYGGLQEMAAGGTLTVGANASLTAAGGSLATIAGTTLDNHGQIQLDLDPDGYFHSIAASFVNDGGLVIGSGPGNKWTFTGGVFQNAGSIEIGGQGTLAIAAGVSFANTGVITVDNNAVLELDQNVTLAELTGTGSIDNAGGQLVLGGTLDLGGGTLNVASSSPFSSLSLSGTVQNGTITVGDGVLALPGATLDAITVLGTLSLGTLAGGYSVTANDGLTFAGAQSALLVNGGALTLTASQTLDNLAIGLGYGSTPVKAVIPRGTGFNGAGLSDSSALTFGAGVTLTTLGSAYITAQQFTNLGQIQVSAGNDLLISAAGFTNAGSIAIASGATLELDITNTQAVLSGGAGTISNVGGTLILSGTLALAGGTLDATTLATLGKVHLVGVVQGGTIKTGGGTLTFGVPTTTGGQSLSSGLTLDGVTVQGKLDLTAAANAAGYSTSISIIDGLTLESASGGQTGSIDLSTGQIVIQDNETLDHVGILVGKAGITPVSAAISDAGGNRKLTLGSQAVMTVAGSTTIAVGTIANAGTIVLEGSSLTLAAQSAASNTGVIAGSGRVLTTAASLSNTGVVQATSGGVLVLGSSLGTFAGPILAGGTYEAQAGGELDLSLTTLLTTDAATILLDGSGAAVASFNSAKNAYQPIETTLKTISATGTLAVLGGRSYASTNSLSVAGLLQLGGGSLTAPGVAVSATGRILGYGSFAGPVANAGSIEAQGGLLQFATLTGTGALQIDPTGTLEIAASSEAANFSLTGGTLRLDSPAAYTGTLTNFAPGDTLILVGTAASAAAINGSTLSVSLANGGTLQYALSNTQPNAAPVTTLDSSGDTILTLSTSPISQQTPCFLQGTRVLTARGEIPVEALAVGDIVPTLIGSRLTRIRWIGHRRVACRRHPKPGEVQPIRIQAGAFGPGTPCRELFLSPDHAVYVEGALIPIRYLVNGSSIAQLDRAEATYWHVELDTHNVLLAEGLPVESYLDTGNRGAFGGAAIQLHPDFALRVWETEACAQLVTTGPVLAAARRRLLARATGLGHVLTTDPDLRLLVAGRVLRPQTTGQRHVFHLPPQTGQARLLSRITVPAHINPDSADYRRLGVAVAGLWLDGCAVPPQARHGGWRDAEPGWQWTDGDAALECLGADRLELDVVPMAGYWHQNIDILDAALA